MDYSKNFSNYICYHTILTIINFKEIDIFDHSSVIVFFESKLNSLIILILVGSILIHSNIGFPR